MLYTHLRRGFTLIELLVVIAIIALLSSVVVASLNDARDKARYVRVMADFKAIETASQAYYSDVGSHAPDVGNGAGYLVPTYIRYWPTPPCAGWSYDWENWIVNGPANGFIGVTLRNAGTPYWNYCTDRSANCTGGQGTNVLNVTSKKLSCS